MNVRDLDAQEFKAAYPGHDLLALDDPHDGETVGQWLSRTHADEVDGDMLYTFLLRELCHHNDPIDLEEAERRLLSSLEDLWQLYVFVLKKRSQECVDEPG